MIVSDETFSSGGSPYKMTVYPAPADGKKHSMIVVLHGNAGLNPPFGSQIHRFAETLARRGYVTAVPQYYHDNLPHLNDRDPRPHVPTLHDAIAKVAARGDADADRLGLIGYSLGAAIAMTYIGSNAAGKVKVLVDFFGPIENNPIIASGVAKFPRTIILHNKKDKIVTFLPNSKALDGMLPNSLEHLLVPYEEESPQYGFHPFIENGPADVDSRKQATEWVLKYLPPTT
jgi:carboxymethylenebutenolidase